jgi:hypothetical protein
MKKIIITTCVCISIFSLIAFNSKGSKNNASEYIILWSTSVGGLEDAVNSKLRENWSLAGGVHYTNGRYYQAVYE